MNAKTDGWELWTDLAGRRHWRWPATDGQSGTRAPQGDARPRQKIGVPQQQQTVPTAPVRLPGK
jgi:phage baseplate assembly protein gpV